MKRFSLMERQNKGTPICYLLPMALGILHAPLLFSTLQLRFGMKSVFCQGHVLMWSLENRKQVEPFPVVTLADTFHCLVNTLGVWDSCHHCRGKDQWHQMFAICWVIPGKELFEAQRPKSTTCILLLHPFGSFF